MKTHQVQQKTERRISAALRLVFVAALLLGQIALAFFLSTELRQRAAIIYTVLELAAFGYAVRIYNRTDGASYNFRLDLPRSDGAGGGTHSILSLER